MTFEGGSIMKFTALLTWAGQFLLALCSKPIMECFHNYNVSDWYNGAILIGSMGKAAVVEYVSLILFTISLNSQDYLRS